MDIVKEISKDVFLMGGTVRSRMTTDYELENIVASPSIQTHLMALTDNILSRSFVIKARKPEDAEMAKTLTAFLNDVNGIETWKRNLCKAVYTGTAFSEVVWEILHDYKLVMPKSFNIIPSGAVKYGQSNPLELYIDFTGGERYYLKNNVIDDMISVYNAQLGHDTYGLGLIEESGVLELWREREFVRKQAEIVLQKYSQPVLLFSYDPILAKTDEGIKELEDQVKEMRAMQSSNNGDTTKMLGVPIGGYEQDLSSSMMFQTLDHLKPASLYEVLDRYDRAIEMLLTSDIKTDNSSTGSFARENVVASRKTMRGSLFTKFISSELMRIIYVIGQYNGFDSRQFYVEMIREVEGYEALEVKKLELENDKLKLSNAQAFATAYPVMVEAIGDMKSRGLEDTFIAETLGVDPKVVASIEAKPLTDTATETV